MVQTDLTTMNGSCGIRYSGVNIQGMNHTFNNNTRPYLFNYSVGWVPDVCADSSLRNQTTGLYSDAYSVLRTNNKSRSLITSITLDQCAQYGESVVYNFYGNTPYIVIDDGSHCYSNTCLSRNALPITVQSTPPYGVTIYNSDIGAYTFHQCGVSDSVCPNDFIYNNSCGSLNGICALHSITDPDCGTWINMRCGIAMINESVPVAACSVPIPVPRIVCDTATDCVYENTLIGETASCYDSGSYRTNAQNEYIQCIGSSDIWCPYGYGFNTSSGYCEDYRDRCDVGCPESKSIEQQGGTSNMANPQVSSSVDNYMSNEACFLTDSGTGKRYNSCMQVSSWPEPIFLMYPIIVVVPGTNITG
jgi:hypothetical protein